MSKTELSEAVKEYRALKKRALIKLIILWLRNRLFAVIFFVVAITLLIRPLFIVGDWVGGRPYLMLAISLPLVGFVLWLLWANHHLNNLANTWMGEESVLRETYQMHKDTLVTLRRRIKEKTLGA